jgi:hypothetical protein
MKRILPVFLFFAANCMYAQGEVESPLTTNPNIIQKQAHALKIGNSIDSTFVYYIDTIDVYAGDPVFDDFSTNRFVSYNSDYADANVTTDTVYHLMNPGNTSPLNPALKFCDSSHARIDTVSVVAGIGTTTYDYFAMSSVWVNDLSAYPVSGMLRSLYEIQLPYQQCYVIIDSLVDGVWDDDRDTIFYSPDFVQDSAFVFLVDVNDTTLLWIDENVYRNFTYAVDPYSLGVATFDGVDAFGWPYDWGNLSAHEEADVLTSRPINLAGKTDVYLTFIYQAEGHGNSPEVNDSLLLDIWLPDSGQWYNVWSTPGGITNDQWDTVHYAVTPAALDNGFQFRFRNWASTSGNLDHWHIDYVRLKNSSSPVVDYFNDLAIAEPINTLLKDYTAVPWDHYKNAASLSLMRDTTKLEVFNSAEFSSSFDPTNNLLEISFGGAPEASYPMPNVGPNSYGWNANWQEGQTPYPYSVFGLGYFFDPAVTTAPEADFEVKYTIAEDSPGQNIPKENDTTYLTQSFRNFYAYDDGSAEAAYGITGSHGMLAYKFTAYEADTLTGILMHFMPTVDDVSNEEFLLTIWDDNAGMPGAIIYQDDYFNTNSPEYSGGLNGFRYYTFMEGQHVAVPQTFYIGWEQIGSVSLNIGMDKNIDNGDKVFRNVTGVWQVSSFDMSLLMRPVFSTGLNETLSAPELGSEPVQRVQLFPNPASDYVQITGVNDEFTVRIFDMTGRQVSETRNENLVDISEFTPGLYIVDVRDQNGLSLYSGKLIKE